MEEPSELQDPCCFCFFGCSPESQLSPAPSRGPKGSLLRPAWPVLVQPAKGPTPNCGLRLQSGTTKPAAAGLKLREAAPPDSDPTRPPSSYCISQPYLVSTETLPPEGCPRCTRIPGIIIYQSSKRSNHSSTEGRPLKAMAIDVGAARYCSNQMSVHPEHHNTNGKQF